MSSPQYRRVSSSPDVDDDDDHHGIHSPTRSAGSSGGGVAGGLVAGRSLPDRVTDKLVALVWVVLALLVAHYTDFITVILGMEDITNSNSDTTTTANRTLIRLAFGGLGLNTILTLYLMVYLPKVKKLKADPDAWKVYCPRVIPIMTFTGVVVAVLLIRGTWPKWGFLAPLILGIEVMGFLFSLHFLPICWGR